MPKQTVSFAKFFSPPSATAWAQTYHAGNVYTVVSVIQTEENPSPEHALPSAHVVGKDIINNLEAEYFAIAEKTLGTMQEAVINACKEIPQNVSATVIFAVLQEHVLYLFLHGSGHVYIKRGDRFGILLQQPEQQEKASVLSASGNIQPGDMVILASEQFMQAIPEDTLKNQTNNTPSEIIEIITPQVDDEKHAGAAAIFFSLEGTRDPKSDEPPHDTHIETPTPQENKEMTKEETEAKIEKEIPKTEPGITDEEPKMDLDEKPHFAFEPEEKETPTEEKKKRTLPKFSIKQVFFLLVAITLAGVLGTSIFVTQHKQQNTQAETLFASEFPAAQQKYTEGQSLLSLNKSLAQDDFQKAKTTLEDLQGKLPANTSEAKQVSDLLQKTNQALGPQTPTATTSLKTADDSASPLLAAEKANSQDTYFSAYNGTMYASNNSEIDTITTSGKSSSLYKNSGDWSDIGGFGAYLGNFYIIDKKTDQILKFTKAGDTYGKTNYLPASNPSLSQAVALTIDGSIWVLLDNGPIKKFTKGNEDAFTINKLSKPLSQPTRILTSVDMDNLYILDSGNSRIVVVKKDTGDMIQEYTAPELKTAKDIDVDEKNKKIYILNADKILEIDM